MRKLTRSILATGAVAGLLALPVAATADNPQVIDASVANTVTIDQTPASTDIGTLPVVDTPAQLGSITVSANDAYTLSVASNYATMTGWTGTAYDESRALDSSFTLTTVNSAELTTGGVGVAAVPVSTTATPIATNPFSIAGLLSTTDVYDLTAIQAASALDPAGAYRIELTYSVDLGV